MFLLVYVLIFGVIVVGLLGAMVLTVVIAAVIKAANARREQQGMAPLSEVRAADVIEAIGSSHPKEPLLTSIKKNLPPWFGKLVKGMLGVGAMSGLGYLGSIAFTDYIESSERLARLGTTHVVLAGTDDMRFYPWAKIPAFETTADYADSFEAGDVAFPEGVCVELIPITMNGENIALALVQGEYIYDDPARPGNYLKFVGRPEAFREKTDEDACAPRIDGVSQ